MKIISSSSFRLFFVCSLQLWLGCFFFYFGMLHELVCSVCASTSVCIALHHRSFQSLGNFSSDFINRLSNGANEKHTKSFPLRSLSARFSSLNEKDAALTNTSTKRGKINLHERKLHVNYRKMLCAHERFPVCDGLLINATRENGEMASPGFLFFYKFQLCRSMRNFPGGLFDKDSR